MVRQNSASKGVIAKIFFPKGLWVKCETPALAGAFSFVYSLIVSSWVKLISSFGGFIFWVGRCLILGGL
jgi:hypothetical protein